MSKGKDQASGSGDQAAKAAEQAPLSPAAVAQLRVDVEGLREDLAAVTKQRDELLEQLDTLSRESEPAAEAGQVVLRLTAPATHKGVGRNPGDMLGVVTLARFTSQHDLDKAIARRDVQVTTK